MEGRDGGGCDGDAEGGGGDGDTEGGGCGEAEGGCGDGEAEGGGGNGEVGGGDDCGGGRSGAAGGSGAGEVMLEAPVVLVVTGFVLSCRCVSAGSRTQHHPTGMGRGGVATPSHGARLAAAAVGKRRAPVEVGGRLAGAVPAPLAPPKGVATPRPTGFFFQY